MSKISTYRPVDRTDPGFSIPGHKLRWVNAKVSESNPGRPWVVVKKENLSPEVLKHIEKHHPGAFAYGNTCRRGDLVLASCPVEVANEHKAWIQSKAREQEARITPTEFHRGTGKKIFEEKIVDENMAAADLIDRFKK